MKTETEDKKVCHSCGTKYGELGFEEPIHLEQGDCSVCSKSCLVGALEEYGGLPYLPKELKARKVWSDVFSM